MRSRLDMTEQEIIERERVDHLTVTPESRFLCDDGNIRTWKEMVTGIRVNHPDQPGISEEEHLRRYHLLLWSFGACRVQ